MTRRAGQIDMSFWLPLLSQRHPIVHIYPSSCYFRANQINHDNPFWGFFPLLLLLTIRQSVRSKSHTTHTILLRLEFIAWATYSSLGECLSVCLCLSVCINGSFFLGSAWEWDFAFERRPRSPFLLTTKYSLSMMGVRSPFVSSDGSVLFCFVPLASTLLATSDRLHKPILLLFVG